MNRLPDHSSNETKKQQRKERQAVIAEALNIGNARYGRMLKRLAESDRSGEASHPDNDRA